MEFYRSACPCGLAQEAVSSAAALALAVGMVGGCLCPWVSPVGSLLHDTPPQILEHFFSKVFLLILPFVSQGSRAEDVGKKGNWE